MKNAHLHGVSSAFSLHFRLALELLTIRQLEKEFLVC